MPSACVAREPDVYRDCSNRLLRRTGLEATDSSSDSVRMCVELGARRLPNSEMRPKYDLALFDLRESG